LDFGQEKRIGLKSFLSDDVRVTMTVSNNFAMLTFTTSAKRAPVFALLPAKPRTTEQPVTGQQTAPPGGARPPAAPTAPPAAAVPAEDVLEVPTSPIDLWTILVGIALIALLVGGFALYRVKSNLDQPPTVTGTGMPPSANSVSAEAAPSNPLYDVKGTADGGLVVEAPLVIEEEVDYMPLTVEQKLELEKFVFHSLSQGFSEDDIRASLLKKGWPKGNVEEIMGEVSPK
jgi:hypothetical protein